MTEGMDEGMYFVEKKKRPSQKAGKGRMKKGMVEYDYANQAVPALETLETLDIAIRKACEETHGKLFSEHDTPEECVRRLYQLHRKHIVNKS